MTREEWLWGLDLLAAEAVLGMDNSVAMHVPFTRSIADAWTLVEKMRDGGVMVSVSVSRADDDELWWTVCYPKSGSAIEGDYAPTAPLSIVLCALEWKGIEPPPEPEP